MSGTHETVGDMLRMVFPDGIPVWRLYEGPEIGEVKQPAHNVGAALDGIAWVVTHADPIDVFAAMAFLLSRSGAYHHIQPVVSGSTADHVRRVLISGVDRKLWREAGVEWVESSLASQDEQGRFSTLRAPAIVERHWNTVLEARGDPIFSALPPDAPNCPKWWASAMALLAICDEACWNVGFLPPEEWDGKSMISIAVETRIRIAMESTSDGEGFGAYTLSHAHPDVVCILPKSRTPQLGCTLRSLSHNLAMLPPRGLARARWLAPDRHRTSFDVQSPLNLLLIPYPFQVPAKAFRPAGLAPGDENLHWGWFEVGPLDDGERGLVARASLLAFTKDLIRRAQDDVTTIHGVVFPELALSETLYEDLVTELLRDFPGIEFIASGLNSHRERSGNYAAATIAAPATEGDGERRWVQDVRQKHHRWRLDRRQIATYALGSSLDPELGWWEKLDVFSRSLTVGVLRGATTITTLICEDLARVDPAQELLRAIGPNIVLALLMDGPQLETRWPNRYATVLADDPGSSVLTFTSMGLIDRVNRTGFRPPSRCFALWRDDLDARELNLPIGSQALTITLTPSKVEEATLDGRSDNRSAVAWRLTGVAPVSTTVPIPDWVS